MLVLCLAFIWIYSLAHDWQSVTTCVRATVSLIILGLILDVVIVRRRGFWIEPDGLRLQYAFYHRTLRWEEIEGFEWRRWIYSKMWTYLWAKTRRGRVRIPTTGYAEDTWMGKAVARYLSSRNVCQHEGEERDALDLLNDALASHRRLAP